MCARPVCAQAGGMTGGFWAPIVIPIVATIALFSWVGAVYYANAHPGWRGHTRAPVPHITGIRDPIDTVGEREPAMTPDAGAPPGQAGATAPKPRAPSESEQLERQSRERRLPILMVTGARQAVGGGSSG